jgi:hypothetical protein
MESQDEVVQCALQAHVCDKTCVGAIVYRVCSWPAVHILGLAGLLCTGAIGWLWIQLFCSLSGNLTAG